MLSVSVILQSSIESSHLSGNQTWRHQLSLLAQETLWTLFASAQHDRVALQPAAEIEPCRCHELVLAFQGCIFGGWNIARGWRCRARSDLFLECRNLDRSVFGKLEKK